MKEREEKLFCVKQLINMSGNFTLQDVAGRRALGAAYKQILTSREIPMDLIPAILDVFPKLYPNSKERIDVLVEIISELREPLRVTASPKVKERSAKELREEKVSKV
jgi:hypothetical protein